MVDINALRNLEMVSEGNALQTFQMNQYKHFDSSLSFPNCSIDILTYNQRNVVFKFRVCFWEITGVTSIVSHLCLVDFYGRVSVLQFLFKMKNPSFELFVLTCSALIVMFALVVQEHLLTIFLPVKEHLLDILLIGEGAG